MEMADWTSGSMTEFIDSVKAWVFPLSLVLLFIVYPWGVLIWTIVEGRAACKPTAELSTGSTDVAKPVKPKATKPPLRKRVRGLPRRYVQSRTAILGAAAIAALIVCIAVSHRQTLGFVLSGSSETPAGALQVAGPAAADTAVSTPGEVSSPKEALVSYGAGLSVFCASVFVGVVCASRWAWRQASAGSASSGRCTSSGPRLRRVSSSNGVLRHSTGYDTYFAAQSRPPAVADLPAGVPWFHPPAVDGNSMWHNVDLHVKTWLSEDTGLYRYVNEIPKGALQKFEMQTRLEHNVIREDPKGSTKLQAFAQPVPFNYGCFPQTYRDPNERDEVHNAPGDDDPLDVIDLTPEPVGVGAVRPCRVLGAVCLIDEGQADYKVFVVNTEANDPIASAKSIEEVEKIAPGRIEAALKWMDDFKEFSSQKATTLHYEIHGAEMAKAIIEKDYVSYQRLSAEAGSAGTARGHWIRPRQPQVVSIGLPAVPSSVLGAAAPGHRVPVAFPWHASSRGLTMRRQASGSDSESSEMSSLSPGSSDAEVGI